MSGMGIEFMTGAMLLSSIRMVSFLIVLWVLYRLGKKVFTFINSDSEVKTLKIKWELIFIGVLIFGNIFFSGSQPRLTIETNPNRELMEYQRNTEEVVIETPPPRTQTLDGFKPLNEN